MDESASRLSPALEPPDEGVFRALADTTRQRLLQLLLREELNVSELVEVLGQPQSTVSRHLKILREAGLLKDRRLGTATLYWAPAATKDSDKAPASDQLHSLILHWLKQRPFPVALRERLQRVVGQREADGTGFFNRLGKRWDALRVSAFGEAFATEALLALLPEAWTVADLGTGTGYLLPMLADSFERIIAVEPAEAMLECSRQRVKEHGARNVEFHRGELSHLPLQSSRCDLALAILVLHHVESPSEALVEIHRVIKPGGRLLIVEQESHENQAFYERMRDSWWGFIPGDLAGQLAAAGFENVGHRRLSSPAEAAGAADAPPLFVMTGDRAD